MNVPRRASQITPKIVGLYSKLFRGVPVDEICGPNQTPGQFYADLLVLNVDRAFIGGELERVSRDACLGHLKGFLNSWFRTCIHYARSAAYDDVKKAHALETLSIAVRGLFAKSLPGWEMMEVFAGSVSESDAVLMGFTNMIADIVSDTKAPSNIRHLALQLALVYMCGAGQTSLGSYFLRRDLFHIIVEFTKDPETEKYAFEAVLLLSILLNFHRSDAARLNPYFRKLQACEDIEFFRKVNWAADFALNAAVESYRKLSDDTPPQSLASGIISMVASWRPDKALSSLPVDPPKELFKQQPIEAAVGLLPIFEMVHVNKAFSSVIAEVMTPVEGQNDGRAQSAALLKTLSLSSYILAHASSTASARALAYANLSLRTLLGFLENEIILDRLFEPIQNNIQLSRQRLPTLPFHKSSRAPVCAILDCNVLWLRHNLQYKLEVSSYLLSVNIVQRVLWYLRCNHMRLEYEWKELWSAILGLLNFVAIKGQHIMGSIELGVLVEEAVALLEYALSQGEKIFPSPKALHEFIYELIRFSNTLQKLGMMVGELPASSSLRRTAWISARTTEERLSDISQTVRYYEQKVSDVGAKTAREAMRAVAKEIESEGLHGIKPTFDSEPPKRVEDAVGFIRYACSDMLALI